MTAISFQESATLPAPRRIFCRRRQRAQAWAAAHLLIGVGATLLASLSL